MDSVMSQAREAHGEHSLSWGTKRITDRPARAGQDMAEAQLERKRKFDLVPELQAPGP